MTTTVELPLWLLVLVLAFAAIAALDRVLVPSARWYLRRRMERMVAHLNQRLDRPIAPFKLMRRHDMVMRLTHDAQVAAAISEHTRTSGTPEDVVLERVRNYAKEIVPAFSAILYFGFATRFARRFTQAFYRVRIASPETGRDMIDKDATVVFVMNHRSNMDYVLVTWLVADRSALSYAVGEWARIWPMSALVRAMGAYFIRRRSLSPLYRRVLARYVQLSAGAGVTQAFFPEGGLSIDGRIGAPKVGLLSYLMATEGRDLVFVPVGIAYDRVLEDRSLTEARPDTRRFRIRPFEIAGFMVRTSWRLLRGRFPGFGSAGVAFGTPVSLRAWRMAHPQVAAEDLARHLMGQVARTVPVLPVPLVAAAISRRVVTPHGLLAAVDQLLAELRNRGATVMVPQDDHAAARQGLRALMQRGIVIERQGRYAAADGKERLLAYYAAGVLQQLGGDGDADHTVA